MLDQLSQMMKQHTEHVTLAFQALKAPGAQHSTSFGQEKETTSNPTSSWNEAPNEVSSTESPGEFVGGTS